MPSTPLAGLPDLLAPHSALTGAERPLLTYCDDATGERVELSASALSGWAARTAGLLREGCGLDAGARAAVLLPPHWQTAAVLLGAWSMGISVSFRPWATAGLAPVGAEANLPLDVLFVSRTRLDSWLESVPEAPHRFVLNPAPGSAGPPVAGDVVPQTAGSAGPQDVPPGYQDFVAEASRYSATLPAYGSIRHTDAASPDGTTYRQWGGLAQEMAERLDLRPGDRLLVDAAKHEQPVMWLLAPLAAGASVVLCANLDRTILDARIAAEGITRML